MKVTIRNNKTSVQPAPKTAAAIQKLLEVTNKAVTQSASAEAPVLDFGTIAQRAMDKLPAATKVLNMKPAVSQHRNDPKAPGAVALAKLPMLYLNKRV